MAIKPKHTKSSGGVVLNNEGKVLVVSQHGTSWSLPKGHVDPGEDELAAAKREIYEEAGIQKITFIKKLGEYTCYRIGKDSGEDTSELKHITIFLFSTTEKFLKPVDHENPEARWVAKDNVAEFLTHPKDKAFYLSVLNQI